MGRVFDETLTLTNLPAHLKAGYSDGYIAKADVIYAKDSKSQADINEELARSIGNVSVPVTGVKAGDKILALADKKVSATLSLTYEKKTGDSAKKIYLNGIGGATIASIDATDFVKDKVVSSAELVETAETGVNVEVPYIKLVFNDASTPVRFSVKSLVDVYTGANLKLSTAYSTTEGAAPANGVSVDAAVKNIATRLGTVEGKTYVDSIGGKKGAITLNSGSTADGAVNFAIDAEGKITATTVLTGYAKTSALSSYLTKTDAGTTYATKTELQNAQKSLGDSIAENTTNINANTSSISDLQSSMLTVTETANNAIKSVKGGTATGSFITIKADTTAAKAVTVTATVKTIAVNEADDNHDGLTTAKYVKDYVLATVAAETSVAIEPLSAKIDANTTAISKLGETYLTAVAASETEYDEWDAIVAATN